MASSRSNEDEVCFIPDTPSPVFTSKAVSRVKKIGYINGKKKLASNLSGRSVTSISSVESIPHHTPSDITTSSSSPCFVNLSRLPSASTTIESPAYSVAGNTITSTSENKLHCSKYSLNRAPLKQNGASRNDNNSVCNDYMYKCAEEKLIQSSSSSDSSLQRRPQRNEFVKSSSLLNVNPNTKVTGKHVWERKVGIPLQDSRSKRRALGWDISSDSSDGEDLLSIGLRNDFVKSSSLLKSDAITKVSGIHVLKRKLDSPLSVSPSKRRIVGWDVSSDSSDDEDLVFNRCLKKYDSTNERQATSSVNKVSEINLNKLQNSSSRNSIKSRNSGNLSAKRGATSSTTTCGQFCDNSKVINSRSVKLSATRGVTATAASQQMSVGSSRMTSPRSEVPSEPYHSSPVYSQQDNQPTSLNRYSTASHTLDVPISATSLDPSISAQSTTCSFTRLHSSCPDDSRSPIKPARSPIAPVSSCHSPLSRKSKKIRPFVPVLNLSPEFLSARHHSLLKQDAESTTPLSASAASSSSDTSRVKVTESSSDIPSLALRIRDRNVYKVNGNRKQFMKNVNSDSCTDEKDRKKINQNISDNRSIGTTSTTVTASAGFASPTKSLNVVSSGVHQLKVSSNSPIRGGDHSPCTAYKTRRVAHNNASPQGPPVRISLSSIGQSPVRNSPSRYRVPVTPGGQDNPITVDDMTPETRSALRSVQQLQEDENVARLLQEQLDREFAMSLQTDQEHSHHDSQNVNPPFDLALLDNPHQAPRPGAGSGWMSPRQHSMHQLGFDLQRLEGLLEETVGRRPRRRRGAQPSRSRRVGVFSPAASGQDYENLLNLGEMLGEVKSKGLSKTDSARLPLVTYKKPNAETVDECNICMNDYEEGDTQKILPCFHSYHAKCIDKWLMQNASCPICRVDVKIE